MILAQAPSVDGYSNFRLRRLNEHSAVVEIERAPDDWHWCVYRCLPLEKAVELFQSQTGYQSLCPE